MAAVLDAHRAGARIALATSGTSARPRRVVRTAASWVDSFSVVAGLTGLTASSRVWLPGPLGGTLTLFAATLARHVGAAVVTGPDDATHAHLTPGHLARALAGGTPLDGLAVTVAGESLPLRLRDEAVGAGADVTHYYGAAELSFVAWGSCADDLRAFPGVEVAVRDGVVWARSPYLAQGYAGADGALRRTDDGFATVGDRGRLVGDRLVVLGRGDDAVTTGGATVLLADVEAALAAVVRGAVAVVGVPHASLGGVVAAVLTDPSDLPAAHAAARGLEAAQRPRLWFHRDALPLSAAGKTDRAALAREAAVEGHLRRLVPVPSEVGGS